MLTHPATTVPARLWSPQALPQLPRLDRPSRPALLAALALIAGTLALSASPSVPSPPAHPQTGPLSAVAGTAGLPVRFEANLGQTDTRARFIARSGGTTLFLADDELVLAAKHGTVHLGLVGADAASIAGAGELPGVTNYYIGPDPDHWVRSVPSYSEVHYSRLMPGIDLAVHARRGPVEYDYQVAPGANPRAIAIEVSGAKSVTLDAGGALVLATKGGQFRQAQPVAYQQIDGSRRPVDAAFTLQGSRVGFRVGAYDPSLPLVIDPTISYSTYVGGNDYDEARSVAVDSSGNAYVAGWTNSADFPTSPPAEPNTGNARLAFVTKLGPTGTTLVYSNFFGGTGGEFGNAVAVRGGDAYVAGETGSTDFPTTPGAFSEKCGIDGTCQGGTDGFVTRFSPTGTLLYSTYLGGRSEDRVSAVAVDSSGTVFLTGSTNSTHFPTTPGSLQPMCGSDGACDANATFTDGASSSGSTTYTSGSAGFTDDDLGKEITGTNIPPATTIAGVTDGSTITLSQAATADGSNLTFNIANTTFTDGSSTAGSPTYTSALPHFLPADAGKSITGDFIPADTTIQAVNSANSVTLSANADGTGDGLLFTVDRHSFTDGASTIGTPNYTSATAAFTDADRGKPFSGDNIPDGTTITNVVNATTVTLSQDPTAAGTNLTFTVDRNFFQGPGRATSGSTSYIDFSRSLLATDAGRPISGDHLAADTTIVSVPNNFTAILSKPATASGFASFRIGRDTRTDGVGTLGSTTFTSATANFVASDTGKVITGSNIPDNTTIASVESATSVTLSAAANATGTGITFTVERNTFHDGVAVTDSPPFTSATANFQPTDVGRGISGTNLADGTTIAEVLSSTEVMLSPNATGTGSSIRFTIARGRQRGEPNRSAFMAAIDPAGDGPGDLTYSTYLGGFGETNGTGIALSGGDAVITGNTRATDLATKSPFQGSFAGDMDGFVSRITPGGAGGDDLVSSTFLGGGGSDTGNAVAVTSDGIYVTGETNSGDFPVQDGLNPPCPVCNGEPDAFATRLTPDGSALQYSTLLGGGRYDGGFAIAVDSAGNAFVGGTTDSSDFPTVHPVLFDAGDRDGFVTKVSADGSLAYSTYLGGEAWDQVLGIAVTTSGDAIAAGGTYSSSLPTTSGAVDRSCGTDTCNGEDAFVLRLGAGDLPAVASVNPPGGPITVANSVQIRGAGFTGTTAVWFGDQAATFAVLTDGLIQATSPVRNTSGEVEVTVTGASGVSLSNQSTRYRYGEGLFTPTAPCTLSRCGTREVLLPTGKVLALVGEGDAPAELYDPLTGTWSATGSCTNLPGPGGPQSCSTNIAGGDMVVLSGPPSACGSNCGKVLVSGGYGPNENIKAAFLYDPDSGTWRRTGDMNLPRVNHSATLLPDGTVLVAGGCQLRLRGCGPSGGVPESTAELYNPLTETWSYTGEMGAARAAHPAVLLDPAVGPCGSLCGKVLVVGGVANGLQQESVEAYDPSTKTWSLQAPMNLGRYAMPALQVANGTVVEVGSYGQYGTTYETFTLPGGPWSDPADLPFQSASEGDAVRLPNGKILSVPGGSARVQLYDPATSSWAPTGPLVRGRGVQNLVVLPSGPSSACGQNCGKVLIAGENQDDSGLSAELYTPRPILTSVSPASSAAAGGATVTVTGTGLTTVTSVRFGDVNGTNLSHDPDTPDTKLTVTVPAHAAGTVDVTVFGPAGRSPVVPAGSFAFTSSQSTTTTSTTAATPGGSTTATPSGQTGANPAPPAGEQGYAMAASDGGVFDFGTLPFAGSLGGVRLNSPIVGMEHTPSGRGYWLVGADGGVFAFGDAAFKGSLGGIRLAQPIVGLRSTPSGSGYWLVGADGGVFAFGDAGFKGSTGAIRLRAAVVGMERSATGNGYWLVAADGGVFAFGDAPFKGSTGGMRLAQPVVAITRSAGGAGYRLVAADGGVFAFGDATFRGSMGALRLNSPIVGMARLASGDGYWLCAKDGGVFAFGTARFAGSLGGMRLNAPIVGCSTRP